MASWYGNGGAVLELVMWYGVMVRWPCGGLVATMILLYCGAGVVVWWCGGVVVWWFGVVLLAWCVAGGVVWSGTVGVVVRCSGSGVILELVVW